MKKQGFATRAVQSGAIDPVTGAHITPIYQTSTFAYGSFERGAQLFSGEEDGYLYSRIGNPTTRAFEQVVADLENAEDAVAFASGMAAISALLMSVLTPPCEVLLLGPLYGGTDGLFLEVLERFGVKATQVTEQELPEALKRSPALLYLETPTNPTLQIRDLDRVAALARAAGVLTVVDNTFSTPWLTRPLEHGIDLVLHSATKYLGGHGDAMGGVIAGSAELMGQVRLLGLRHFGGVLGPLESHLFLRGIKTLPLRMEKHCSNAQAIAEALQDHPAVKTVHYPGLPGHPGHEVAKRQMKAFGGMVSIELHGGQAAAAAFLDNLGLFTQAVSLGDVASLATHPASTTHQVVPAELRAGLGVSDSLVRLSVGIEDPADLISDLQQALAVALELQPA
jgi:methionine-gamma-lyase